jgi:GT2 family glycosyltransferase
MTCFNRRAKTIKCLDALFQSHSPSEVKLTVFLVDDGGSDGTSEAVSTKFPEVRLIRGTGELFWGGGMRLAFAQALFEDYDFYVWLNDDTVLYRDSIARAFNVYTKITANAAGDSIVLGTTRDHLTGEPTYGGQIWMHPKRGLKFSLVRPSSVPLRCDTINGNFVVIPRKVVEKIGILDDAFDHSMGDIDYGLRAVTAGCTLWVMPGFVGTCSTNSLTGTFNDRTLPLRIRLRKMLEPKGLPISSWKALTRRHTGCFWIAYWLWPYGRVIVESLARKLPFFN